MVENTFSQSRSFFQLSQKEKDSLGWESPESNRGYVKTGREKVSRLEKGDVEKLRDLSPDVKESLEIGKEFSGDFKNRWPKTMSPLFREIMINFYEVSFALNLSTVIFFT